MQLINGDCLDEMKKMADKSIDVIFCDLPYGQTNCKWDTLIDLDEFWKQVMRIKKLHTPIIMTCTTKFGASLINSAPKKCPFRYDLIWCKSAPTGFLRAKKAPMRKHEMIYLFYEREPFYDISSHKHKFIKERETNQKNGKIYEGEGSKKCIEGKYNPPLPTSLVKENGPEPEPEADVYGYRRNKSEHKEYLKERGFKDCQRLYDPPLPTSLVKIDEPEPEVNEKYTYKQDKGKDLYGTDIRKETRTGKDVGKSSIYDPPLPTSLVKIDDKTDLNIYFKNGKKRAKPKTNNNIINGPEPEPEPENLVYGDANRDIEEYKLCGKKGRHQVLYDPPLPTSLLEVKSTKGKHSTEKPVSLMEWILKYYSKVDDVIFDPTMGSGSMGVACKNMNRKFIGIEMDEEIFKVAEGRLAD